MRLSRSIAEMLLRACNSIPLFYQQECTANLARYEEEYAIQAESLGGSITRQESLSMNLIRVATAVRIAQDIAPHVATYESVHAAWNISAAEPVTLRAEVYESLANYNENMKPNLADREIGYDLVLMHREQIVGCVTVMLKKSTESDFNLFKRNVEKPLGSPRHTAPAADEDTDDDESLFGDDDEVQEHMTSSYHSIPGPLRLSRHSSWVNIETNSDDLQNSRIYQAQGSTHSFLIQNVWNLVPDELSNVGVALMHEAVTSLIRENKHLALQRQQKKSKLKYVIKRIKSAFNSLNKRGFITAPGKTDSHFWELKTHNSPITLESVFEAMTFYDKLGFQLENPNELISKDPQFPEIIEDLEAIASQDYSRIQDTFLHRIRTTHDENNTNNTVGIIDRFRSGNPTERDWWELISWRDSTTELSDLNNERLDYEEFVARYPLVSDYLDKSLWLTKAGEVMRMELDRIAIGSPRRAGYHMKIPMILGVMNSFFRDISSFSLRRLSSAKFN